MHNPSAIRPELQSYWIHCPFSTEIYSIEEKPAFLYDLPVMLNVLTLANFRNHDSARINSAGFKNIVITGPNGSGKTAILEAISMLSGNGGLRGASMPEIAKINGYGGFAVHTKISDDTTISVSFSAGDTGRKLRIDNEPKPLSAACSVIRIIWLTPKEDRLFAESASDRRAFLDRLVAGFDPVHTGRVARLNKLLSERAFAIKSNGGEQWLDAIESQLAGVAASVAAARVTYAAQLNHFLQAETNSQIILSGWFESRFGSGCNCLDAEKEYRNYLSENRALTAGNMVIDGAHKSDFSMFRNDLNMNAAMLSAGQQKKLLMLLIIANAKLLHAKISAPVLILLDEALSHFDPESAADLLARLDATPAQVWITGAYIDVFPNAENSLFVSCADGDVSCKMQA